MEVMMVVMVVLLMLVMMVMLLVMMMVRLMRDVLKRARLLLLLLGAVRVQELIEKIHKKGHEDLELVIQVKGEKRG